MRFFCHQSLCLLSLQSSSVIKEETAEIQCMIDVVTSGNDCEAVIAACDEIKCDLFVRAEMQMIKAVVSTCSTKVHN